MNDAKEREEDLEKRLSMNDSKSVSSSDESDVDLTSSRVSELKNAFETGVCSWRCV